MKNRLLKETNTPFVSVIVPVYNDSKRISKCIKVLMNQTYPHEKYEVIVVDNGSTDKTYNIVQKYSVKLLSENKIHNSYGARNMGIKNAQGEVIAFTDSDCIPYPDWIEKGVANLLRVPNCGLVAGKINLFFKNPNNPNAVELYDSIMGFNQKEDVEQHNFGSTANVFAFKKVFKKVGLFNDSLKSGGDNEWGRRVFSYGYKQIYADDVSVAHPARYSINQLYRRITRLMGGHYEQHLRNSYSLMTFINDLIKSMRSVLALTIGIILDMFPEKRLKDTRRKIQFIFISICVEIFRDWQRMRFLKGYTSKR